MENLPLIRLAEKFIDNLRSEPMHIESLDIAAKLARIV